MSEMRQQSFIPEKPLGKAIIICERVITDAQSRNKTIVSTFNQITAKKFPCKHPQLSVYVALTNGTGKQPVELRFKKEVEEQPLMSVSGEIEFADPNRVVELIFNFREIVFPDPGVYLFEIF